MIVGICGYGYTGSGALYSLLQEFDGTLFLPNSNELEFMLSYATDGLEDLEYHLCQNPVKGMGCDYAIFRFNLLINDLERWYSRLQLHFRDISKSYIASLLQAEWKSFRIFEWDRLPGTYGKFKRFDKRLRGWIRTKAQHLGVSWVPYPSVNRFFSILPDDFLGKTRAYVEELLGGAHQEDCLVLNQPFSATNPLNGMKFFPNPRCVIVDRDPRDLYVMAKYVYGPLGQSIPTDTVGNFVRYYRAMRTRHFVKDNPHVLFVQFENLVHHYQETIDNIIAFLEGATGKHISPKTKFKPEVSAHNTFVFPLYPKEAKAIDIIEHELKDWLFDFSNVNSGHDKDGLRHFAFM